MDHLVQPFFADGHSNILDRNRIGQHPIQRNLDSVHHFPEEVIPIVDYSHCEILHNEVVQ